jgi:hypothetical protein
MDYQDLKSGEKNYAEMSLQKKKAVEENKREYEENSRKRFNTIMSKKFQTVMIGALSAFEKRFGELWGHDNMNPTSEQEELKGVWEEVRNTVLDNGNKQLRAAQQELQQYTMSWNRYQTTLKVTSLKDIIAQKKEDQNG